MTEIWPPKLTTFTNWLSKEKKFANTCFKTKRTSFNFRKCLGKRIQLIRSKCQKTFEGRGENLRGLKS